MKKFIQGWALILAALRSSLRRALTMFEVLLELILGKKEKGVPVDCFNRPQLRARPDPYIYSQYWLQLRGIAYTWDNPDFSIIDPDTGLPVDSHALKPGKLYHVQATIHNSSIMAAIGTQVAFEVLRFGAGTAVLQALGQVSLDVPALGSALARITWITPSSAGHNCLRATISQADDANPLNNVGQHNTDVATSASPTRKLRFHVGNHSDFERTYSLHMNSYHLPEAPLVPGSPRRGGEAAATVRGNPPRGAPAYLELLRARNDFAKFPVPAFLNARLGHEQMTLAPGDEVETFVEVDAPPVGTGRQQVNVNVMLDGVLVGGVTAYVEEA